MFGFEDNLLHKLAKVGNVFTANHMQERYWPVHVSPLQRPIKCAQLTHPGH